MPTWVLKTHEWMRVFVTQGSAWVHVAVFLPLGLIAGCLVVWWMMKMVSRESHDTRPLSRGAAAAIILGMGLVFAGLVLAVIGGECQSLPEGGSIDWAQWRLLYHYVLIALLVAAATIDFDQYIIPDQITIPGVIIGTGVATCLGNMQLMHVWVDWNQLDPIDGAYIPQWIKLHPHWHGFVFSVAGLVTGGGITWLARLISRWMLGMEALGFGDVTLMAMIGSFLGWQPMVFVFLLAPVGGTVVAMTLWLTRARHAMPYGPYLSAAAIVVLFLWRWLWIPTREVFGHWPTLIGLALGVSLGMAVLLGLLRLYRAIPVETRAVRRHDNTGD